MTKIEFGKGMAILSACGLSVTETSDVAIWEKLLMDLEFVDYEVAIINLCKNKVTFFPGDNVPALIREGAHAARQRRLVDKRMFEINMERKRLTDARERSQDDFIPLSDLKRLIGELKTNLEAKFCEKNKNFLSNSLTNTQ